MLLMFGGGLLFLPVAIGYVPQHEDFVRNRDVAAVLLLFAVPVGLTLWGGAPFILAPRRIRPVAVALMWLFPLCYAAVTALFVMRTMDSAT